MIHELAIVVPLGRRSAISVGQVRGHIPAEKATMMVHLN